MRSGNRRNDLLALGLVSVITLVGLGRPALARQLPGRVPGQGRGIYANPYMQPYALPRVSNGNEAFLFFLASQYQAAQMAKAEQGPQSGPIQPQASPYHQMRPGGADASSYFGRSSPRPVASGPAAPARFNRLGGHFGNRGHNRAGGGF